MLEVELLAEEAVGRAERKDTNVPALCWDAMCSCPFELRCDRVEGRGRKVIAVK